MQIQKPNAAPGGLYILNKIAGYGATFCAGTTVPADNLPGFAPGCVFIDMDAAAGSQYYVNEGTALLSDFNTIPFGAGTLNATALEINRAADVSTRIVSATAATLTVTEADHDGKIILLDRAAGIAVTLPAAAAGLRFRFIVKTTFTAAATIKSVTGADVMIGHATMGNDSNNGTVDFQALASSTFDTINLFGTANSTGGIAGQRIEIIGLAANLWFVEIQGDAAGTEATPFEDTVT